jgi:hypothetical protein
LNEVKLISFNNKEGSTMRLMTIFVGMLLLSFGVTSNGNATTQVLWTENFDYSSFSAFEANWDLTTVFFPGYPGFTEGITTIENGQLSQEVSNNQKSEWKSRKQIPLPVPGDSEPTSITIDMIRLITQGNAGSWLAVLDASGNGYAVQHPYDPFAGFGLNIREIIGWSGISPNHGSVPLSQDMALHR